jgi:hypothetical protein
MSPVFVIALMGQLYLFAVIYLLVICWSFAPKNIDRKVVL